MANVASLVVVRVCMVVCVLLAYIEHGTTFSLFAQQTGTIIGRIVEQGSGRYLPGVRVTVLSSGAKSATISQRTGEYRLTNMPVGALRIEVSAIGFIKDTITVDIAMGQTTQKIIELRVQNYTLENVVVSVMREGQARALNQQKNADNIRNVVSADLVGRFPDPNVADALQRIPGITIDRDQGEGRFVQIRGTSPIFNSIMVNGERLPSPEASGDRSVALDVIPSDILSSVEVSKAITPDMDGDAIGGAVNLITRSALDFSKTKLNATAAGGYANLTQKGVYQGSLTFATTLGEDKNFGFLINGTYQRAERGSDNNEIAYAPTNWVRGPGDTVKGIIRPVDLQLRNYDLTRQRRSITTGLDYRFNDRSSVYLRGMYNNYSDDELRRTFRVRFDRSTGSDGNILFRGSQGDSVTTLRIEPALRMRRAVQQIHNISFGGKHGISTVDIDYNFSIAYAEESRPNLLNGVFRQDIARGVRQNITDTDYPQYDFTNRGDTLQANPGLYNFNQITNSIQLTKDRDLIGSVNVKFPVNLGDINTVIQTGVKMRSKQNSNALQSRVFTTLAPNTTRPTLSDTRGSFTDENFLFQRYNNALQSIPPDPERMRGLFDAGRFIQSAADSSSSRITSDAAEYSGKEDVFSGYAMSRFTGDTWTVLAGLRYENTSIAYTANRININSAGRWTSTQSVDGSNSYGNILPSLHATYRLDENTNIRVAWTNTLSRPRYVDNSPVQRLNIIDNTAQYGNPDLSPATSMNNDAMIEHFLPGIGIISGGVFHKSIRNFVFNSFRRELINGLGTTPFLITQPLNGESASLFGAELSWQQQFTFLPSPFDGFGVFANFTWTNSEAIIPIGLDTRRTVSLPGQAKTAGNIALSYEKYGFMARIAGNFIGSFIDEIGSTADFDRYQDQSFRIDFSANYRFAPQWQIFVEAINLTNQPLRFYRGVPSRPDQREFYSWWSHIGVRFDL